MSVRHGREFLAIPGPTNIPDAVLGAMHHPAVDIYTGSLLGVTESCFADLAKIFRTEGRIYIYAANGHGAWEAALVNVLSPGDQVLVLESGMFANRWGEMAETLGLEAEVLAGNPRGAVDPAALEARLRQDTEGRIKALLVVQVDTASGVVNDIPALAAARAAAGHQALLLVDAIASLATMPFEMDAWGVDLALTGSQKGLMTPPGLSFVAAGERAQAAHAEAGLSSMYFDWSRREGPRHYDKYCGTPPEHLLFGLRRALDLLLEEGLEAAIERHRLLAQAVRSTVEVWCQGGGVEFNIPEPGQRANSVTTIVLPEGQDAQPLLDYCRERCGVVLGLGLGDLGGRAFRIAHMGHVNAPMILGTLAVVETALAALDIPHGRGGVQAAIDGLAEAVKP